MKKKYVHILFAILMMLIMAVGVAGCGNHEDETLAGTDALADAMTVEIDTEIEITTAAETETAKTENTEVTENMDSQTADNVISEKEAEKILLKEFGAVDEGSGDKNVFIYEEIVTVDSVDYYSYRWEDGDGTYLCNAFVRTDGTDAMTGIYADGRWELGSDMGSDNWDDSGDDDEMEYDEEYDNSEDVPYDDGFGDVDSEGEEPAEDDEIDNEAEGF